MRNIALSLALALTMGCGGEQPAADQVAQRKGAISPTSISVQIMPRIEGITVYAGYWGPGLPPGDPGYQYVTGVTKATGLTFSVPGSAVCANGFTTAKALDDIPVVSVPKGMEMKFAMPGGAIAGMPGLTPFDNEVATVIVGGQTLAPLPTMTYTGNNNRNLFVSSWLFGCTP